MSESKINIVCARRKYLCSRAPESWQTRLVVYIFSSFYTVRCTTGYVMNNFFHF